MYEKVRMGNVMKNLYPLLACVIISMNFLTLVPGIVYAQQGEVIVPNVTGIKQELAIQILRTTGLQAQIQNMSHSSDIIVQQSPQPGIYLSMGSVVTLVSTSVFKESSASWSSQQQNQITTYPSPSFQPAQTASVYQLYQVPASQYWVGQTQVKRYPIWYPKQFLPQQIPNSFQDISFPPSTTQRLFVQMTTSSDGVSFIKVIPGNMVRLKHLYHRMIHKHFLLLFPPIFQN